MPLSRALTTPTPAEVRTLMVCSTGRHSGSQSNLSSSASWALRAAANAEFIAALDVEVLACCCWGACVRGRLLRISDGVRSMPGVGGGGTFSFSGIFLQRG